MRVDLIQRSPEWFEWRKGKITGSKIGSIMGVNKFCSPRKLWQRELGIIGEEEVNHHMQRGIDNEQAALEWTNKTFQNSPVFKEIKFEPSCFQHDDYPWAAASLDGYCKNEGFLLEIKCPSKMDKSIPEYYKPQLQWGMFVSGCLSAYYVPWCNAEGNLLFMHRDDAYIRGLLEMAQDFRYKVANLIEPDPMSWEKEHEEITHPEAIEAAFEFERAKREMEHFKSIMEEQKAILVSHAKSDKSSCCGLKISKVIMPGRIDYDLIHELQGRDLSVYRKESTESWRVSR